MLKLRSGRTLYYGKGDVLSYRTYAAPLEVEPIAESAFSGDKNVIFAHHIRFAVSGEPLLDSFVTGDNSLVVATDSMKNFILRHTADFEGSTTEGLLSHIGRLFMNRYAHIDQLEISADRIPFHDVQIAGSSDMENSGLVFRSSHNEHAGAAMTFARSIDGAIETVEAESSVCDVQLIKVSGSSFYGFVRDEYTSLPESFDRPLFIFLALFWRYEIEQHALDASCKQYVPAEQIRDIAGQVFHESNSPSIQHLIYQIGRRILARFPQLKDVRFESNNRTWETVVSANGATNAQAAVYTEPRPPFGFQGFTMTKADLAEEG
ncbi:factor-independent urate hydroxylase [Paenibacillus sp. NEAU-GSW1]|uniref:factor-independent urate hydroxylase n=1 Tax=Paenibacillus sp. NEAU-GSW1 TaxID=2682486 RepID=UPI0012E31659|nr:urate oxidase [Paenibacillus sp. NEAU-GSW1]MUT67071.1 urate oxidase [Paenibacillus sp. NEAU-GSW1]